MTCSLSYIGDGPRHRQGGRERTRAGAVRQAFRPWSVLRLPVVQGFAQGCQRLVEPCPGAVQYVVAVAAAPESEAFPGPGNSSDPRVKAELSFDIVARPAASLGLPSGNGFTFTAGKVIVPPRTLTAMPAR